MTPETLDDLLHAWGRAYGERPVVEYSESARAPDVHPLAQAMRFAPGTRKEAAMRHVRRSGEQRRRLMAQQLHDEDGGGCGIRIVPADFVDPVPGTRSTNSGGYTPDRVVPMVEAVQQAWLTLFRFDTLRGRVVQAEFQWRGMVQQEKADKLGVNVKRYRDQLAAAKIWLHGRLAE